MKSICALVIGASFGAFAPTQQRTQSALQVAVCDLVQEPERYNGKLIEIHAQTSSSEEGSVIFDQGCKSILFLADSDSAEFRKLARLLKSNSSVKATLVGVFEHAADRRFGHQGMWDSRFIAKSVSDVRPDKRGWLVGTAATFGESGFVTEAAKVKLVVACKDQRTTVNTDERGDYGVQLDRCKYQLVEVIASNGKQLNLRPGQARSFNIRDRVATRFDVMVSN